MTIDFLRSLVFWKNYWLIQFMSTKLCYSYDRALRRNLLNKPCNLLNISHRSKQCTNKTYMCRLLTGWITTAQPRIFNRDFSTNLCKHRESAFSTVEQFKGGNFITTNRKRNPNLLACGMWTSVEQRHVKACKSRVLLSLPFSPGLLVAFCSHPSRFKHLRRYEMMENCAKYCWSCTTLLGRLFNM